MTSWPSLTLRIIPQSPLQLGTESGVATYETTALAISGAAVRGAVAGMLLERCTQPAHQQHHAGCPDREACPFWQIFGADEPLWSFAYPALNGPAYPFPLTARTCKLNPGFQDHGVYDTLIGQFVYDLLTDPRFPLRERLQPDLTGSLPDVGLLAAVCPQCEGSLKQADGVYSARRDGPPSSAGKVSVRRATHVGINRARGVAEEGLLFTQDTIETQIPFHGQVTLPADKASVLRPYVDGQIFWVGQGRSRGNGRVKVTLDEAPAFSLQDRLDAFQAAVGSVLVRIGNEDGRVKSLPGALFSLTLRSPLILERQGQPVTLPTTLPEVPDGLLLRAWARPEVVGGWDTAARLPRRTRLAAQAGSVFLYWTPRSAEDADLVGKLQLVESRGLGEERPRGYGQVAVCDPFHQFNPIAQ